ncbi:MULTISPECIES: hypothetical protein [unclassified Acinetobacter]|uniref:hypothetical protein n=1 Tax=unclassified Acinetobacter TaxID=196816 RepID=UPI0023600CCE|nr:MULTISPECIES: hypothetical protein [unclassified Acinetobacter]
MADPIRKAAILRSIETWQLPENFISALENAEQAHGIAETIQQLEALYQQWN